MVFGNDYARNVTIFDVDNSSSSHSDKANNGNVNFLTQFCLWNISNGSVVTECREVFLKGNVHDYNTIDKFDLLSIYFLKLHLSYIYIYLFKYLMVKTNIKWCLGLLNKCFLYY